MRGWVVAAAVVAGLGAGAATAAADAGGAGRCERGELCLWARAEYRGTMVRVSLEAASPGECVPLPAGFEGRSFANRMSRYTTVYQGRGCSTEGEFDTYPGGGTYVPEAPYVVRGVQVWDG